MNNNEINTAIKCLNNALYSNVLDTVKYDINLNVIAKIIDKKKNNLMKFFHLSMNQKINNSQPSSSSSDDNNESYTTPINDSITATAFNVPSELYVTQTDTTNKTESLNTYSNSNNF